MTSIVVEVGETFPQQIHTPLSQKPKTFCGFFINFLKFTANPQHSKKKDESHSLSISEIIHCERGGYLSV